jgi:hypothetical protein
LPIFGVVFYFYAMTVLYINKVEVVVNEIGLGIVSKFMVVLGILMSYHMIRAGTTDPGVIL